MKTTAFVLILFFTGLDLWAQLPPPPVRNVPARSRATNNPSATPFLPALPTMAPPSGAPSPAPTLPAAQPPVLPDNGPDNAVQPQKEVPGYTFTYDGVDVSQVLDVYANLVGKTLIRGTLPQASIVLKTQTPLTKTEAIQALQAVLAVNNISVIPMNDKFVKVLPTDQAGSAGAALDYTEANNLPDMGSYVTHIVQLKYVKPTLMMPLIQPLAKINSIIPIDDNGILVIRDYAENVKRMLEMIQQVDINTPQEYTNEVIEIKYALADDIANALNSLGGTGAATVAIGSSGSPSTISGVANPNPRSGTGGSTPFGGSGSTAPYGGQRSTYGPQATTGPAAGAPGGAPATGATFQDRLRNIIANAARPSGGPGQQQDIQIFGQAKIIADARANSLLVFATHADMERIKAVIAKLDVLLSQVLIESIIMDVGMNKGWNFGVSAAQNPKQLNGNPLIIGGGGMNNGQPFLNFLKNVTSTNGSSTVFSGATNGVFTSLLPSGLSYFGNIGPTWDVAVQAAANDNSVNIIQRPRIQTSQAKAAQFFVGNTVPYITGTSYGSGISGGNSSTYSTLSVGIELDVTPFINPDGLVVMDINQEIDDISGSTTIDGNPVPTTDKRTLSSEIAVKDKDTIMLGGFIRSDKTKTKSGVPILQDIPILGALFSTRSSSHNREELVVLMRPTVLRTPEIAAKQTEIEEQRLPGISAAAAENDAEEGRQIAAERKAERRQVKAREEEGGFFTPVVPVPPPAPVETNIAMPLP